MSESMNSSGGRGGYRKKLLTSVCALALLGFVCAAAEPAAADDDSDHPVVWIELGGQLERMGGGQTQFDPSFFDTVVQNGLESPLKAGRPSIYSNGAEGTISFTPNDSDWVFSASVRYGRADSHRFLHQQTKGLVTHFTFFHKYRTATGPARYAETKADSSESHVVADFQAGKDVGLGMFGKESTSVISAGVRFAQFNAKSSATVDARPNYHFTHFPFLGYQLPDFEYHEYYASAQRAVSFRGLGPSLSWKASAVLKGSPRDGEIALDWGANAAILFGKQKARTHHHTATSYHYNPSPGTSKYYKTALPPTHHGTGDRSHEAVVPNLGAFAGLSFRYTSVKISVGYRGDFFFGAMDGGLDMHKSYNQEFYGPFATLSIGIGG